ncbi:MAG: hypothetical protein WKG07_13730 [Hymenobacter sp.]
MEYQLTQARRHRYWLQRRALPDFGGAYFNGRYRLKRVEYVRYPIRLGEDVFATGEIPPRKADKFVKFLHALKLLMEVHEVAHCLICATSAMRTATQRRGHRRAVSSESWTWTFKVIDGQAEAFYINRVIEHVLEDNRHYLHIDVGAVAPSSTSTTTVARWPPQSFEIGSIRRMQQEESGRTVGGNEWPVAAHGSLGARKRPPLPRHARHRHGRQHQQALQHVAGLAQQARDQAQPIAGTCSTASAL